MKDEMNIMPEQENTGNVSRRKFLGYAGGVAGAGLLLNACKKEDEDIITDPTAIDLGSNDKGLTNLLFVAQQIEVDFYEQVLATTYTNMSSYEWELLTEIHKQEIAQREFLRNYLKGEVTVVTTDFSTINFSNRANVLNNAILIEDLVTATFNEAARLYSFSDTAEIIVKMGSVEARHAATLGNLSSEGYFFGPVDIIGSEPGSLPSNTVIALNKFLQTKVSGNNLPNQ